MTNQEMTNQGMNYKELLHSLYDRGIKAFKDYYVVIRNPDGTNVNEMNKDPPYMDNTITFEEWYSKIFDGSPPTPDKFYKIIQSGNFGMTQPCGGYVFGHYMSCYYLKTYYHRALGDKPEDKPALMVITNPSFGEEWKDTTQERPGLFTHETKDVCILYNEAFNNEYRIQEDPQDLFGPNGDVSFFKITNTSGRDIKFANFHGKIDPENVDNFTDWVVRCKDNGIHYITGDSGLSYKIYYKIYKKGQEVLSTISEIHEKEVNLEIKLRDKLTNGEIMAFSKIPIKKKKQSLDIVWNNDIENTENYNEIDGRFVIELNKPFDTVSTLVEPVRIKDDDGKVVYKPIEVGTRPDTPQLNGIDHVNGIASANVLTMYKGYNTIADQNVVRLNRPEFNLMSATSFLVGKKEEWLAIEERYKYIEKENRFEKYHNKGRKYTMMWLQIYNDWIKEFNGFNKSNPLKEYKLILCEPELEKDKNGKVKIQPNGKPIIKLQSNGKPRFQLEDCTLFLTEKYEYEKKYKYPPSKSKPKYSLMNYFTRKKPLNTRNKSSNGPIQTDTHNFTGIIPVHKLRNPQKIPFQYRGSFQGGRKRKKRTKRRVRR